MRTVTIKQRLAKLLTAIMAAFQMSIPFIGTGHSREVHAANAACDIHTARILRSAQDESLIRDLGATEQTEVYKAVEKDLRASFHSDGISVEDGRRMILDMDTDDISVGKRGRHLLQVTANSTKNHYLCSPTGNCALWLFLRNHNHLRLVLAGNAVGVEVSKRATGGMHDLALRRHMSASQEEYTVYRWAGSEYKEAKSCMQDSDSGNVGHCPF
jgi:hypothetical protein